MGKNQDEVGKSSGETPIHYERTKTTFVAHGISADDFLFSITIPVPLPLYLLGLKNNLAILGEEISYPNINLHVGGLT